MGSTFDGVLNFPIGGSAADAGALPGTSRDVYGEDVVFNDDTVLSAKGDYAITQGEDNLRRAVWRRLIVRPGEYKTNPKYGVGVLSFVKKGITKSNMDELRHRIIDNLSLERRINKVLSVEITERMFGDQTGISILIVVQALGRTVRLQPFNFTSQQAGV